MSDLKKFILVGYIFAQIIEFQFNILITKNYGNWIFTLIYYPVILTLFYLLNNFINKISKNKKVADIAYLVISVVFGLFVMEWWIIGNSPWGNPEANQLGMISFWIAVLFMPRIFINSSKKLKTLKKKIIKYITIYAIITTFGGAFFRNGLHLAIIIWGEIIGYTLLYRYYYKYLKLQ